MIIMEKIKIFIGRDYSKENSYLMTIINGNIMTTEEIEISADELLRKFKNYKICFDRESLI